MNTRTAWRKYTTFEDHPYQYWHLVVTEAYIHGWKVGGVHPAGMLSHYHPQRSWGKVIFSQVSVILFTGGLPQCMLGYHPPPPTPGPGRHPLDQVPPGTRHPQDQTPPDPQDQASPLEQSILGDTVNERAVCILLECNLVTKDVYFLKQKKTNKQNSQTLFSFPYFFVWRLGHL